MSNSVQDAIEEHKAVQTHIKKYGSNLTGVSVLLGKRITKTGDKPCVRKKSSSKATKKNPH